MSATVSATVILTREQLYERIWAKPVRTVAAEFGISDVGLKKICVRHDIPRPSPSYWGLSRHGKTPPRVPLPPRKEGVAERIEIRASDPFVRLPSDIEIPVVEVPSRLDQPHAVVRGLRKLLGDRPGQDGILAVPGAYGSIVRTSPGRRERALILFDSFFKALEARGHKIVLEGDPRARGGGSRIVAVVGGPKIDLKLVERLRQTDHVLTVKELADKARGGYSYAPKYDHVPSGLFTLTAGDRFDVKKTWAETAGRTMEKILGEVIAWIEWAAPVLRDKERENDERNRRWQLEARRSEHERFLAETLHRTMGAWSAATEIRTFLQAIERDVAPEIRAKPELVAFVTWAASRADALDPLRRPEELAKDVDVELLGFRRQG